MASLCRGIQNVTRLFAGLQVTTVHAARPCGGGSFRTFFQPQVCSVRLCSTYDPYQRVEDPPSPFRQRGKDRIGYKLKIYTGGPLPRPEGKYENIKVKKTGIDFRKRDAWIERKALFGQNDYIDILGDGTIHPAELMEGPLWLRRFKGNELQRYIRRLRMTGRYLKDKEPEKYHAMYKQMWYLYKKKNIRKRKHWWSGRNPSERNRIFNIRRLI